MKRFLMLFVVALIVFTFGCATVEEESGSAKVSSLSSGNQVTMWNFESNTTDGWYGKGKWSNACTVNADEKFVKEGKYSLKIQAKGSKGWNQDIAINDGPFIENFGNLKSITMDVYVPVESMKRLEYGQIFLVISGSANSWYQLPQGLKPGWNKIVYKLEEDNIAGDIWHIYFVFNSGGDFKGPVYIDNVTGNF